MQIEYIEWQDAGRIESDEGSVWIEIDKLDVLPATTIKSCGFVIRETDKLIVLAGHIYDGHGAACSGNLIIPKGFITKRVRIKTPR